jgi:hypothetical protein
LGFQPDRIVLRVIDIVRLFVTDGLQAHPTSLFRADATSSAPEFGSTLAFRPAFASYHPTQRRPSTFLLLPHVRRERCEQLSERSVEFIPHEMSIAWNEFHATERYVTCVESIRRYV